MGEIYFSRKDFVSQITKVRENKKIVFTNGCFDLIHPGHIYIFQQAALLGDILVVGLNDDDSIQRIKGVKRPILDQKSRAIILSALEVVDYVVTFNEDTPYELIKELKPDVLVKGAQYGQGDIVGEDIAVDTVRIKMQPGFSTTDIVDSVLQKYSE